MRNMGKLVLMFFLMCCSIAHADESLLKRKDVQRFVSDMVRHHGFDKRQLLAILREAQYQPQIIESMNKPFEKKTWDVYKALFLTEERVQKGIEFWRMNQAALEKAQKRFGVPAHIIVAIIGVETLYGERQGNYRVLDALSTLAFYYPKRAEFFTKELKEYLLLCREQRVSVTEYKGSYAGAIGKPQFMPSSYRFYAVDFTGNGKRDLVNDDRDVIGSVANYFHKHGWIMNEGVAEPAIVNGSSYKQIQSNARKAEYDYSRIVAAGITPVVQAANHPHKVGLIELTTPEGQEFWLAYPNFYVITRYNTSPQYALVVYLLSQQLQRQWAAIKASSATNLT
ncbi:lytic murein transglycosylase B [Legionella septentrionalis]|uniref:lytic murein transglycosylase B n=1 Tax=Legionella septentrionalis TaxID=2498109 RepID=UPI000F8F3D5A|nr:lytic murein transglycosylase B [Legionella septentrionalis]RUR11732.1 lytic murein transglycosylase B [Legionella septentrionalis]